MKKEFKSPVYNVIAVPIDKLEANDYNPNHVAKREMDLLYQSIKADGYTMPVVCFYDKDRDKYIIVDGFHRYTILLTKKDIFERENGMLPVSVIEKEISDRMASTIRHNRARGKHKIDAMSDIVIELKRRNWSDEKIGRELGMDADEVLRLTQITGLAEMFKDREFSEAWEAEEINEDDNLDEINE